MTETPLMNDDAARSTTGEILDQSQVQATTQTTETSKANSDGTTTESGTTTNEKPAVDPAKPEAKLEAKPEGAPEKYGDFKAPDGYTLSADTIAAATPIFKELGLNQDQAQKLVDFHAKAMLDAAKAPQADYAALRTDWQTKVKSDTEILGATSGGKTGMDAVKLDIGRAFAALPPALASEMKEAMDLTGAGDHPAIVKGMWKLAQFVTEGKHVSGAGPSPAGQKAPGSAPPTAAAAMYPNLPRAS